MFCRPRLYFGDKRNKEKCNLKKLNKPLDKRFKVWYYISNKLIYPENRCVGVVTVADCFSESCMFGVSTVLHSAENGPMMCRASRKSFLVGKTQTKRYFGAIYCLVCQQRVRNVYKHCEYRWYRRKNSVLCVYLKHVGLFCFCFYSLKPDKIPTRVFI